MESKYISSTKKKFKKFSSFSRFLIFLTKEGKDNLSMRCMQGSINCQKLIVHSNNNNYYYNDDSNNTNNNINNNSGTGTKS